MKRIIRFIVLVINYYWHIFRRNTFCKWGMHKWGVKKGVLALGEILSVPACKIFECGHMNMAAAKIDKPYDGDGMLFGMSLGAGPLISFGGVKLSEEQKRQLEVWRNLE